MDSAISPADRCMGASLRQSERFLSLMTFKRWSKNRKNSKDSESNLENHENAAASPENSYPVTNSKQVIRRIGYTAKASEQTIVLKASVLN